MRKFLLTLFLILASTTVASGATIFYVDPTYTDTGSDADGSAADPWTNVSSHSSAINSALASGDVIIYVSVRVVGSDTQENLGEDIDIKQKTPNPGYTLTINGDSYYNTNDAHESGSWAAYAGSNKAKISAVLSQSSTHTKYNDVTIHGFEITGSTGKAVEICGDNWIIEDCSIHGNGGSPLVLIVPTADGTHEGSDYYCPASTNIRIEKCDIWNSRGELIYVGGGGCELGGEDPNFGSTCQVSAHGGDTTSHTYIYILDNHIYNGGTGGEQGDGIDLKAALSYVTIKGNEINNLTTGSVRAIVTQGWDGRDQHYGIYENDIHDNTAIEDAALAIVDSWGSGHGIDIYNNIFDTNSTGAAIKAYVGSGTIYHNIAFNQSDLGFIIASGTWTVRNNLLIDNNSDGNQVDWTGTITESNNGYSDTFGETCTNCTTVDAGDVTNAGNRDFSLPLGSDAINKGFDLTGIVTKDIVGTDRPQDTYYDLGPYEYTSGTSQSISFSFDAGGKTGAYSSSGVTLQ